MKQTHSQRRSAAPELAKKPAEGAAVSRVPRWLLPILMIAVVAAYANSFRGVMLFDDFYLETSPHLQDIRYFQEHLLSSRLLVDLSFFLNHAVHEFRVFGYHLVNLVVHLLACWTLYALLRRTFESPGAGGMSRQRAAMLAFAIALLWGLHPLQTQSVTYISQRAESMMGLFYLLTFYGVARTAGNPASIRWPILAVFACAAGMLSKQVMVTAPLIAILYDRAFWADTWRAVIIRRWKLHAALAATWLLLLLTGVIRDIFFTVASDADEPVTVGFGMSSITPLQYLWTQTGVVLHYLRLSVWPDQLCLDHVWPVVSSFREAAIPGLAMLALLVATIVAWRRSPALAFSGIWFFGVLLPTSSFIPIQDVIFEHRMYLSLAAVITLAVVAVDGLLFRAFPAFSSRPGAYRLIATALLLSAAVALGVRTHLRNRDYHSIEAMWSSVLAMYPDSPRATCNLGGAKMRAGLVAEAEQLYRRAIELQPRLSEARYNLGHLLLLTDRNDEAAKHLSAVPPIALEYADAQLDLGTLAAVTAKLDDAISHFREAVRARPHFADAHFNLACALAESGDIEGAKSAFREALRLRPDDEEAARRLRDLENAAPARDGPMSL